MKDSPLQHLTKLGQSIWLDYIRRDLMVSGALRRLIDEDGLRGMTSNPAIFEQAVADNDDYDDEIRSLSLEGKSPLGIYEALSRRDVQSAADEFRSIYESTDGEDGYVSLEVNPHLAYDANETVAEARRLWLALARPNVLIKVPGTENGLRAIEKLISEGINVNVTLLFGLPRYRKVAEAYIAGLEMRLSHGKPISHVVSVASFFVSRIDTLVDEYLEELASAGDERSALAKSLRGEAATASAKLVYQIHKEVFGSDRFRTLAVHGASVQRLLWASTGTKNPEYSDTKYIEGLIGPGTVNTVPVETLEAYRNHGRPELRLEQDIERACTVMEQLHELGIEMDSVTQQLEDEGVEKFNRPFDKLIGVLALRALSPMVAEVEGAPKVETISGVTEKQRASASPEMAPSTVSKLRRPRDSTR